MTNTQKIYQNAQEKGLVKDKSKYLKFKGTGIHYLTFVKDEVFMGVDFKGNKVQMIRYYFEEDGVKKIYEVSVLTAGEDGEERLSNFVEQMRQYEYGENVIVEYKSIPGTPRGYIQVSPVNDIETTNTTEEISVSDHRNTEDMDEFLSSGTGVASSQQDQSQETTLGL